MNVVHVLGWKRNKVVTELASLTNDLSISNKLNTRLVIWQQNRIVYLYCYINVLHQPYNADYNQLYQTGQITRYIWPWKSSFTVL